MINNFFSPRELRTYLKEHNIFLTKKYGQYFLIDKNKAEQIVGLLQLNKSDVVLEIGPGIGTITHLMLPKIRKLIAVEIDKGLVKVLNRNFRSYKNFYIYHADFLKFDLSVIKDDRVKIISNLPYNVASQILFRLVDIFEIIDFLVIMVPDEIYNKINSDVGMKSYGVFSIFLNTFFEIKQGAIKVSKTLFLPSPKVDSKIIKLEKKKTDNVLIDKRKEYLNFLSFIFQRRRKKFYSGLLKILKKEKVDFLFKKYNLSDNIRAEDISRNLYIDFFKSFIDFKEKKV